MNERRNIGDLLDFDFNANLFERRADNLSMLSEVRDCMRRLSDLSSRLDSFPVSEEDTSRSFMKEFRDAYENGSLFSTELSNRQLRFLSYHLPVGDYDFLVYVLTILQQSYRPSLVGGFLHSLLYSWQQWLPEERTLIIDCMQKMGVFELRSYKGIESYLSDSGPYRLGLKVRREAQPFLKICSFLCLSSTSVAYPYFSDAIYAYYEEMPFEELPTLVETLKKHNIHYTTLLVLSHQIVRYKKQYGNLSDNMLYVSLDMIGNPEIDVNWTVPDEYSDEKKNLVHSARKIVQAKINERFIRTFFESLCDDSSRRDFWIDHCEKVLDLTVYGSSFSRARMSDYFSEDLLASHFKTLTNNNETCALVMETRNYMIVEFTDVGALYVYQKGSRLYELIFSGAIRKVDDLKISTLPALIGSGYYSYSFNDEGRMIHTGYWQQRLNMWIERKLH